MSILIILQKPWNVEVNWMSMNGTKEKERREDKWPGQGPTNLKYPKERYLGWKDSSQLFIPLFINSQCSLNLFLYNGWYIWIFQRWLCGCPSGWICSIVWNIVWNSLTHSIPTYISLACLSQAENYMSFVTFCMQSLNLRVFRNEVTEAWLTHEGIKNIFFIPLGTWDVVHR